MDLATAIRLVADDTRETTNPQMNDREAIACARTEMSPSDLSVVNDARVAEAYRAVLAADQAALDAHLR